MPLRYLLDRRFFFTGLLSPTGSAGPSSRSRPVTRSIWTTCCGRSAALTRSTTSTESRSNSHAGNSRQRDFRWRYTRCNACITEEAHVNVTSFARRRAIYGLNRRFSAQGHENRLKPPDPVPIADLCGETVLERGQSQVAGCASPAAWRRRSPRRSTSV